MRARNFFIGECKRSSNSFLLRMDNRPIVVEKMVAYPLNGITMQKLTQNPGCLFTPLHLPADARVFVHMLLA